MSRPGEAPLLVLLPGLDGTGRLFRRVVEALSASGVECLVLPYPPAAHSSHEEMAADIAGRIPPGRPIVLLGESFGGTLAARLAHRADLDVRKLILCAPAGRAPHRLGLWIARGIAACLTGPGLIGVALRLGGLNGAPADVINEVAAEVGQIDRGLLLDRLSLLDGFDLGSTLEGLTLPILHIAPTRDRLVPGGSAALGRAAAISVARIPGPHFILQAEPQACAEAIVGFMGGG